MSETDPQPEPERLPYLRLGVLVTPRKPRSETRAEAVARAKGRARKSYPQPFADEALEPNRPAAEATR